MQEGTKEVNSLSVTIGFVLGFPIAMSIIVYFIGGIEDIPSFLSVFGFFMKVALVLAGIGYVITMLKKAFDAKKRKEFKEKYGHDMIDSIPDQPLSPIGEEIEKWGLPIYEGIYMSLEADEDTTGDAINRKYITKVLVTILSYQGPQFTVSSRHILLDGIAMLFGCKFHKSGDEDIDRKFTIKCDQPAWIINFCRNADVKHMLMECKDYKPIISLYGSGEAELELHFEGMDETEIFQDIDRRSFEKYKKYVTTILKQLPVQLQEYKQKESAGQ